MRARIVALLLLALSTTAMLIQPAASATQHWSQIGLSRNGHQWSSKLAMPLFRKNVVLVPGSTVTKKFYVKNRGSDAARLRVSVLVRDRTSFLAENGFRMQVRTGGGITHRMRHAGRQPAGRLVLRPDEIVPIMIRVRLLSATSNRTMDRHLKFHLRLRLTEHRPAKG